jgi:hypothetical protein
MAEEKIANALFLRRRLSPNQFMIVKMNSWHINGKLFKFQDPRTLWNYEKRFFRRDMIWATKC